MTTPSSSRAPGFTLIELMIVVTCIGIMASLAIPGFLGVKARGARTEMLTQLEQMVGDVQHYYRLHNAFPPLGTYSCGISLPGPVNIGSTGPVSGPFNPCARMGIPANMTWDDLLNPTNADPWRSLGQQVNAAVTSTKVRYEISEGASPASFTLTAIHDFDGNGVTGETRVTLTANGSDTPERTDFGYDDEH